MAREADLDALRARLANLKANDLIAAAVTLGWTERRRRGKGSHVVLQKGGRSITIPRGPNKHTYRSILDDLERWS